MKKSIYLLAAFSAVLFSSCAKEVEKESVIAEPVIDPVTVSGTTLRAVVEGATDTKVSANPVGVYAWQESDKIAVLDDTGNPVEFTASTAGASTEFTSASSITLGKYAQYPFSSSFAAVDDYLEFQIPSSITYSADATNMPMLGKNSGDAATFKAVGGLLKLIVYGVPSDASELEFAAKNKKISGGFDIANASVEAPVIVTSDKGSGDNIITIDFDGKRSANMVFYIPLPTGTIDGFDITFNDSGLTSFDSSKNLTIERNDIIVAPAINLLSATTIWRETFTGYDADKKWNPAESIQTGGSYDAEGDSGITYATSGSGTKLYTSSMSAGGPSGEPELLINGSFTIAKIPTNNKANFVLTYYSNKGTGTLSVSSNVSKVKIGTATNSGKLYSIPVTIEDPADVDEIDLVFSAGSNSRLDDIKFVYDPKVEVTPTISFAGNLTRTIGAGTLNTNITEVTLNNPLDGNGIGIVSDVDWLTPSLNGTTLSCTATGYNHDDDARVGHVTLKATGAESKVFTITQNPSIVASPATLDTTPADASFSVTWEGDSKAKSYTGYYSTTDLADPTMGTALTITNVGSTYTATPSGAVINGTKYYVFIKVGEVADAFSDKYAASMTWGKTSVTPSASTSYEVVFTPTYASKKFNVSITGTKTGISATYTNTYASANQMTSGNHCTLTITGMGGKKIVGATVSARSNSGSGAGYLLLSSNSVNIAAIGSDSDSKTFNDEAWYGSWSTSYVNIDLDVTETTIVTDNNVIFEIYTTANSLYFGSLTLQYE